MGLSRVFSIGAGLALALATATALADSDSPSSASTEAGVEAKGDVDADTKAQARKHYERGVAAYEAQQFKDAIDAFLAANRLVPSPALSFNIARAYEKLGDKAGALAFYRDYLRRAPAADDREEVGGIITELERSLREKGLQQVTIISSPASATVVLDGQPVGVSPWTGEIFPGRHQLELRLEGYENKVKTFNLPAHSAVDVTVELTAKPQEKPQAAAPAKPEPAPKSPPASRPDDVGADQGGGRGISTWTWVSFGVGAVGLGGALGFEFARSSAETEAHDARVQVDAQDRYDTMETHQTTARILLAVGAVGTVVGGVLLYFDLTSDEPNASSARVGLDCGPASCGLSAAGRF